MTRSRSRAVPGAGSDSVPAGSGFPSGTAANKEAEAFSLLVESRKCFSLLGFLFLAGCASSSGVPVARISDADIAAAYIPLHRGGVVSAEGAGMAIAPDIAVTNGHNRNLVAPEAVIGEARDYDLLFFRDAHRAAQVLDEPRAGETVDAYGQGGDGELRLAHGVIKAIQDCRDCTVPAYFVFLGDAGPGFSGGPVLNASGALIGITFGYRNEGSQRLIYAYPMSRVRSELSAWVAKAK